MSRISVSFKNNEQDNALKEEIEKHSDKSAFIKDILRDYLDGKLVYANTASNRRIIVDSYIDEPKDVQDDMVMQLANLNNF